MPKETVVLVGVIPKDLESAISRTYQTVALHNIDGPDAHFRVALTTGMKGTPPELFEKLPNLKLIASQGAGTENIDFKTTSARGITVKHTPGVMTDDTADMAIALVFATARGIVRADKFVRAGRWKDERPALSRRVVGKHAGIVGMGAIGRTIAARLSGLGLTIGYHGPNKKPELDHAYFPDLIELARAVDFLILSCPGNEQTRNLINAKVLAALGADGILINVSRGTVVDEEALISVLQARKIGGAGLDVFMNEPDIDPRFLELENVVVQPHSATITHETRRVVIETLLEAINSFYAIDGVRN